MAEELDILKIISDNPSISQRKMAEQTGISLGQVNLLIKKCVKKGLVKIEGQTTKSIKYNLTPKGLAEKATMTMQYIKVSYMAIITLTEKIKSLADQYNSEGYKIYICGDHDEMMSIMRLALGNINLLTDHTSNAVVFYWNEEKLREIFDEFQLTDCKLINVLGIGESQ